MERKNPLREFVSESKSSAGKYLRGLNDSQYKAVTSDAGALLVLAGPGSGKTFVITSRVRFLIHNRSVPPEKILVITFTKDAAVSMKRRFYESEGGICPVVFGTFHSVFFSILRESKGYSVKKLLGDAYKKSIFSKIISEIIPENKAKMSGTDSGGISPEFICAVSVYKNTGDIEKALSKLGSDINMYFDQVFNAYEEYRKQRGLYDFDDMVFDCYELLKKEPRIRSYWRGRFCHILIDEYQDINKMQFETVKLLCGSDTEILAVGDDDQAIYGFRGSRPGCLREFKEYFNSDIVNLEVNYRSLPEIVDIAGRIIKENKNRFIKHQRADRNSGLLNDSVRILDFKTSEEQKSYFAGELKRSPENEGNTAFLFRTNLAMQDFAAFLTKKGIEYNIREKSLCVYEHPAALDIFAYLKLAEGDPEDIYRIINKPVRYISREALRSGQRDRSFYSEESKEYEHSEAYSGDGCGNYIDSAISYYAEHREKYNNVNRIRELQILKKDLIFLKGKRPGLGIRYIRNKIGLDKYYGKELRNERLREEYTAVLDFLVKDSEGYDSLEEWMNFIQIYKREFKDKPEIKKDDSLGEGKKNDIPELMTVHASKGLEFDNVFIPDVNEGMYPHGKMPDTESLEEERRIFYVAVTRAKNRLLIGYVSGENESLQKTPSRFISRL